MKVMGIVTCEICGVECQGAFPWKQDVYWTCWDGLACAERVKTKMEALEKEVAKLKEGAVAS